MIKRIKFALQGRSGSWHSVRADFLKSFPKCEACSADKKLEVHHIKPFHIYPELELDPKNLITLCKHCHLVIGHLRDYEIFNREVVTDCREFFMKRVEAQLLKRMRGV